MVSHKWSIYKKGTTIQMLGKQLQVFSMTCHKACNFFLYFLCGSSNDFGRLPHDYCRGVLLKWLQVLKFQYWLNCDSLKWLLVPATAHQAMDHGSNFSLIPQREKPISRVPYNGLVSLTFFYLKAHIQGHTYGCLNID